jgi:hypothetical protein
VSTNNTNLPKISRRQLSLRNGQDHEQIWISYKNKVYDVTESSLWKKWQTLRTLGRSRPYRRTKRCTAWDYGF